MNPWTRTLPSLTALLLATACSGGAPRPAEPRAAEPSAPATPAATAPPARRTACTLVTEAEMSAILGGAVKAEARDSGGSTTCTYSPAAGISPYAEVQIDWGSAQGAMAATGMLNRAEPGMANPLDGLGDQAAQIGPVLWVRLGEDLVMITFSGVDDTVARAKQIVNTVKSRLPSAS